MHFFYLHLVRNSAGDLSANAQGGATLGVLRFCCHLNRLSLHLYVILSDQSLLVYFHQSFYFFVIWVFFSGIVSRSKGPWTGDDNVLRIQVKSLYIFGGTLLFFTFKRKSFNWTVITLLALQRRSLQINLDRLALFYFLVVLSWCIPGRGILVGFLHDPSTLGGIQSSIICH